MASRGPIGQVNALGCSNAVRHAKTFEALI